MIKISVKWGKELFKEVEWEDSELVLDLKVKLYTLTNVLPEKKKLIYKGTVLKDDVNQISMKIGNVKVVLTKGCCIHVNGLG